MIAQSLDLSGQTNLGKDFSNGIRTYFDAINNRGGVRGRKITFVQLDDSGAPEKTVENITKLLRENEVDVLIGPTSARSYLAALSAKPFSSSNVALLGAPTGIRTNTGESARVLHVRASYRDEARQLIAHATKVLGARSVALVRGEGEESEFAAAAFREEARLQNLQLAFDGDATQWQARRAQNSALEAVVISGDAIGVAPLLTHARATARNATLFGFSTVDHRTLLELSKTAAIGMILSQAMPSAEKTVHSFQREHRQFMKTYRDEPPSLHTLEGYVVARALVGALNRVDGEPTAERVTAVLKRGVALELGALNINARADNDSIRFVNLSAISKRGELID